MGTKRKEYDEFEVEDFTQDALNGIIHEELFHATPPKEEPRSCMGRLRAILSQLGVTDEVMDNPENENLLYELALAEDWSYTCSIITNMAMCWIEERNERAEKLRSALEDMEDAMRELKDATGIKEEQ